MDGQNQPQQQTYPTQQATPSPPVNTYTPPTTPQAPNPQFVPRWLAVIGLLVIVILAVGYYFFLNSNANPTKDPVAQQTTDANTTPQVSLKPTLPAPNGADWQQYADQEIGMTFEYSTEWSALPITDGFKDTKGMEYGHGRVGLFSQKDFAGGAYNPQHREIVRVYDWDNPKGLTLEAYNKSLTASTSAGVQISPNLFSPTTTATKVAGLPAFLDPNAMCESYHCTQYIIPKGKKFLEIKMINDLNDPNYPPADSKQIFDHIIETMKLL